MASIPNDDRHDVVRSTKRSKVASRTWTLGGRSDLSAAGRWFWETDRVLLLLVAVLIVVGLIAVAAASPAASQRLSGGNIRYSSLHFFTYQAVWIMVALPVMIGISMLPKETARRLAIIATILGVLALVAVFIPGLGMERNGARRWIDLRITNIQPSEFLKPVYVVTTAWLLSLKRKDPSLPMVWVTGALTAVIAALLMKQPNFGETVIFGASWVALLTLSGLPMKRLVIMAGVAIGAVVLAYFFYSVAQTRIDAFLFEAGDQTQVDNARRTLIAGGMFGVGPGAGTRKFGLPEPHTDYIFSVIGEEFGLVACLGIAFLYMAIIARVMIRMLNEEDQFVMLAAGGLVIQVGVQAVINMAVNAQLLPSKGMTLPFISYGGSSMLALSIGFGLLLAFSRRNPYLSRSPYVVTRKASE
jgi:cell division protein FtsW